MRGFKVGIDADFLLRMATENRAMTSIHTANGCLDLSLTANLRKILLDLNKKYEMHVTVVMSGLKPPCLNTVSAGLENSHKLWSEMKANNGTQLYT